MELRLGFPIELMLGFRVEVTLGHGLVSSNYVIIVLCEFLALSQFHWDFMQRLIEFLIVRFIISDRVIVATENEHRVHFRNIELI